VTSTAERITSSFNYHLADVNVRTAPDDVMVSGRAEQTTAREVLERQIEESQIGCGLAGFALDGLDQR
jgi:hypothetical protein